MTVIDMVVNEMPPKRKMIYKLSRKKEAFGNLDKGRKKH